MEMQSTNSQEVNQVLLIQQKLALEAKFNSGVNWFYWIGGMSVINSLIYIFGGSLSFVVGLGITQFVDAVAHNIAEDFSANGSFIMLLIGFAFNFAMAGIFLVAGLLGHLRYRWAIILGMILYALDALILLWASDWFGVAFHLFALYGLFGGLNADKKLHAFIKTTPIIVTAFPDAEKIPWYKTNVFRIVGSAALVYTGILIVLVVIGVIVVTSK
jgi:fucose permease